MELEALTAVGTLIAAYGSQIYLVKRLVAFVKEATGFKDNVVRFISFFIGAALGGLFFWTWIEANPEMEMSAYILTGTLFLLTAGLTASGDYDIKEEQNGG